MHRSQGDRTVILNIRLKQMSEMTSDLESLMNEAEGRKDEILLLVDHGWTRKEIIQAIEVTPGVISGVVSRARIKAARNVVPLR